MSFDAYRARAKRIELLEELFNACEELYSVRDKKHMNDVLLKIDAIRKSIGALPPPDKTHQEH